MRVVAGTAKGRQLKEPPTTGTRPIMDRVKTALFDTLGTRVDDAAILDLFGGVGGVGIEALSRGARYAVFVELSQAVVTVLQENLRLTDFTDQADVHRGDAFLFLETAARTRRVFDIIYVAPPQYQHLALRAFKQLDAAPLTEPGGLVIIQIHPKERIELATLIPRHLRLSDERRYGSTLLLFYTHVASGEDTSV